MCIVSKRNKLVRHGRAPVKGERMPIIQKTESTPNEIDLSPWGWRRSGISGRRADGPRARARPGTGWRLGSREGDETRPSAQLAPVLSNRGPIGRPAWRRRRGWHSRGWTDRPGARARARAGGRLRTGECDDGRLPADKHADSKCVRVCWVCPGGSLRRMDRVLGFKAVDGREGLGARRPECVAVDPHRDQSRSPRSGTTSF